MPSSFTPRLGLTLPATGELTGTWGTTVNTGITSLVEDAIAGTTSITMAAADYTLSTTQGAANEARSMFLTLGGTPGAARNVIVPAVSKLYFVFNNTTGGFAQTVKTSAGSGIAVASGQRRVLYCDGTNVVDALNAVTLTTPLATASGGTGLSSFTANRVFYASSTSAVAQSANLFFDGTNLGVGPTSPSARLHASGTAGEILRLSNTDGFEQLRFYTRHTAGLSRVEAQSSTLELGTAGSEAIHIFTNNTVRARMSSGGNLGLGMGTSDTNALLHLGTTATVATNVDLRIGYVTDNYGWRIRNESNAGSVAAGNLRLQRGTVSSFEDVVLFDNAGNIGLGVSPPGVKLDLSGTVRGALDSVSSGGQTQHGLVLRRVDNTNLAVTAGMDTDFGYMLAANFGTGYLPLKLQPWGGDVILNLISTPNTAQLSNSQLNFALTSNTNLRITVRGTDAVVRTANITLS